MQEEGPLVNNLEGAHQRIVEGLQKGQLGQIADTTGPKIFQDFPGPNLTHEKPQVMQDLRDFWWEFHCWDFQFHQSSFGSHSF